MSTNDQLLLQKALEVRSNAYAPYSSYSVGCALLDDQGGVHVACNVENAAFPLGSCAEASAIGAMVAAGAKRISTVVIVGGFSTLESCPPCGGCRQRIQEFADPDTRILLQKDSGELEIYNINDLLPKSFKLRNNSSG